MIEFKCLQCGKNLRVRDEAAGKRGKCPQCGETLRVPQEELVTLEAADASPTPSPPPAANAHATDMDVPAPLPVLKAEADKHLPTRWLNFYVYFRIPVGIVLSVPSALALVASYSDDPTSVLLILTLEALLVCFCVFLFVGLHRRRFWGWRLNWYSLVLDVVLNPLGKGPAMYFLCLVVGALLWFLPNAIYFKKRRYLFTTHQDQSV